MVTADWCHELLELHSFRIFRGLHANDPLNLSLDIHARFIKFSLQEYTCLNLDKILIVDSNGLSLTESAVVTVSSA